MQRLLLVLLLLVMIRPAWGHSMPSSDVILRLRQNGVDARLILPIIELRLGWQKPLPMRARLPWQEPILLSCRSRPGPLPRGQPVRRP